MKNALDTKEKLLDTAQLMIQTRGYNAFSYADLATLVKIKKASIHYYFPCKVDIGIAVTRRYRDSFLGLLNAIKTMEIPWLEKIKQYAVLYKNVLSENRLCLCGALASDIQTLPKKLQNEVRGFFDDNVLWLSQVIPGNQAETAHMIISTLQGGMIMAKTQEENTDIFSSVINQLLYRLNNY